MYEKAALIVVDVQNDFISGTLPVPGASLIIPKINTILEPCRFPVVVGTADWHTWNHSSFTDFGGKWPKHCVAASRGAQFSENLLEEEFHAVIRKGFRPDIDSYSAFMENDKKTVTGLDGFLIGLGVLDVYVCGLALDYCVSWTAEDAAMLGYRTHIITDCCAAIDESSWQRPENVELIKAGDLA